MRRIGACVIVIALLVLSGCNSFGFVSGSGKLTSQDYSFTDFTQVETSHTFNVAVTRADAFSVKATYDDNLANYLLISKDGSTLKLELKPGYQYTNVTLRAVVTMPRLSRLSLTGATRGTASGFSGDGLKLEVSGASRADLDKMAVGSLDAEVSGASFAGGAVTAGGNARLEASGASTVEFTGKAQDATVDASGASHANLAGFAVRNADVNLSGASTGSVNPSGTLSGDISGASHLDYSGTPTLGKISTTGSSSISKK
jgi:hypothetical protein